MPDSAIKYLIANLPVVDSPLALPSSSPLPVDVAGAVHLDPHPAALDGVCGVDLAGALHRVPGVEPEGAARPRVDQHVERDAHVVLMGLGLRRRLDLP